LSKLMTAKSPKTATVDWQDHFFGQLRVPDGGREKGRL
jgi:hypothetical protein